MSSLEVSYNVLQQVAKLEKSHTLIILSTVKYVCEVMFGGNFTQQISDIPLSNDSVCHPISDLAGDKKKCYY